MSTCSATPRLFVFGGWANGVFHNDIHVLQTATVGLCTLESS
jgi:hypothetical protein